VAGSAGTTRLLPSAQNFRPEQTGRDRRDILMQCTKCGVTATGRTGRRGLSFSSLSGYAGSPFGEQVAEARDAWLAAENDAATDPGRLAHANHLRTAFREAQDAHQDAIREARGLTHLDCGGQLRLIDIGVAI